MEKNVKYWTWRGKAEIKIIQGLIAPIKVDLLKYFVKKFLSFPGNIFQVLKEPGYLIFFGGILGLDFFKKTFLQLPTKLKDFDP